MFAEPSAPLYVTVSKDSGISFEGVLLNSLEIDAKAEAKAETKAKAKAGTEAETQAESSYKLKRKLKPKLRRLKLRYN